VFPKLFCLLAVILVILFMRDPMLSAAELAATCETLEHVTVFGPVNAPFSPDEFGGAISVNDSTLVIGARVDGYPSLAGAVFVYSRSNGVWSLQQKLTVAEDPPVNFLGSAVAVDGETIIAGVPQASVNGVVCGAVYLFERNGTNWIQRQKLHANDLAYNQFFGYSVAIFGKLILIGAPGDNNITGAAYVFIREQTNWVQRAKLTASDGRVWDGFGWSVSADDQTLVIGSAVPGPEAGIGYFFEPVTAGWVEKTRTPSESSGNSTQEIAVSVSGEWAAINYKGVPRAVYLFQRQDGIWVRRQTLRATNPNLETGFGFSVALRGDKLAVGSAGSTVTGRVSGLVHIYDYDGSQWIEKQQLEPLEGVRERSFGRKVAVGRTGVFAGSLGEGVNRSGVAYAFEADIEPPVIKSITAKPDSLWPPNNSMRAVEIIVDANDDCGETHCRITSVVIKEESRSKGGSARSADWEITGDLSVNLRATPSRHGQNRVYAITVECQDDTGNVASSIVEVPVLN
jgi:hypothetical protein